jgi:hypothetical protein
MNTRIEGIEEAQSAISKRLTEKIYTNLNFYFSVGVNGYNFVSDKIKEILEQEIRKALCTLTLTPTQYTSLNAFSSKDLYKITTEMAGALYLHDSFNVITGQGIEVTGLTKIYFNSLSCKIYDFVCDTFLLGAPEDTETKIATYDELKGDPEKRNHAIQSSFNQYFSSITCAHANLAGEVADGIHANFLRSNTYVRVSYKMKNILKQEIQFTLSPFTLTSTQYAIFSMISSVEDLNEFAAGMVGTLRDMSSLSAKIIVATGLAGVYFNAVSHSGACDDFGKLLPYDKLKNNYEERKTAILLSFGQQLLLKATPEQCKELCRELKDKDNQLVIALQTQATSFSNLFSGGNNYLTFENQLFGLMSYSTFFGKAISLLIHEKSTSQNFPTNEAYQFFSLFFNAAEHRRARNALPRINKATAEAKKLEIEKLRVQYR